jgi:Leucine-rich repeat (LRR) protein
MYLKSSGNSLKKLPDSFGHTPTIKSLILHHIELESLPDNFNLLESLMELEIQINTAESFDLKKTLSGLYNLKSLMIYKNNLKSFPCGLNKNTKLKKVLIVNSGLTQIDSSFASMENIQTLILDKNKFEKFPSEIFELKTLKELSLRENLLTSLPEDIIRIKGLKILDLTGNKIPKSHIEIAKILLPNCKIII